MLDQELSKPQRQSVLGVAVIFFQNLRKAINIIFSIIVVQFGIQSSGGFLWTVVGVTLFVAFIFAILIYKRFFFYVKEGEFIIEKGLFSREKISIPFERIQSVHINQNLIQRILNVVGLKIDTAGSVDKELEIVALPRSYARAIQEFLNEKRETEQVKEEEGKESIDKSESLVNTPLIRLSFWQVIQVGLTENHLKTSLALFALANGYFWQNQELTTRYLQSYLEESYNWINSSGFAIVVIFIGLLFFSILLSVVQSVLRYYDLQFFINTKGVHMVSGLLKRVEYQIPTSKIQFLKWSSNPLRKLAGLKTLVVKQASSKETNDKQSLMVPGCSNDQLDKVIEAFFPELKTSSLTTFHANSFLKVQLFILFALFPAGVIALLGWFFEPSLLVVLLGWMAIAAPLSVMYASKMCLDFNKEVIQLRKGWLFPKTEILKYYKLQNVAFKQNIFQKRRKLVHLDFYTAAGRLRMWQLDEEVALELYNYILYKIETSNKNWM